MLARTLARNAALNLLGYGAPMVVAYFAVPALTRELGPARFGVLTLAWVVLGYFGLFDFGLGRGLTRLIAEENARAPGSVAGLAWTGLSMMAVLGAAAGCIALAAAHRLTYHTLGIAPEMRHEALLCFRILAVAVPVAVLTTGALAILEAHQRFGAVNAVRIPLGVLTYAGPVAVLAFSRSLVAVTLVLLATRVVALAVYLAIAFAVIEPTRATARLDRRWTRPLVQFGSWMTIANLTTPVLDYADRFVIGAVLSVAAVAYYTAPFEVITKLWIVPTAITAVIFPAISRDRAAAERRSGRIYTAGLKAVAILLVPPVALLIAYAPDALGAWLGGAYAARSVAVVRWIAAGVLVNSIAQVMYAYVQAAGRPDLIARLALIELAPFLGAVAWAVRTDGIRGAAIVWTSRVTVDAIALAVLAHRLGRSHGLTTRAPFGVAAFAAGAIGLAAVAATSSARTTITIGASLLFVPLVWMIVLSRDDRRALKRSLRGGPRLAVAVKRG